MKKLIIFLSLFITIQLNSVVNTDSLETVLPETEGLQKIKILNTLAEANIYKEQQKSISYATKALHLSDSLKDNEGLKKAYFTLGSAHYLADDYKKSINYYEQALEINKEENDKSGIATCLNNIGDVYNYIGENEKALNYFEESLKLKEELGKPAGIARTVNNMGKIYSQLGKYDIAFDFLNRALEIRKELGDLKRTAFTLNELGNLYSKIGSFEKSLEFYMEAFKIHKEINYKRGMAIAMNNTGNVYSDLGNLHKALEFYNNSLEIQEELKFKSGIAFSMETIGNVYKDLKQFDTALDYYNKALIIREETHDKLRVASSYNSIGSIYSHLMKYETALDYTNKAIKIQKEKAINDQRGLSSSYDLAAQIFFNQGSYKTALWYYKKSLDLTKEMNMRKVLAGRYQSISKCYYQLSQFQKAFDFHELYTGLKDSLFTDESSQKIAEMQIKYETEEKEKKIELLKQEKEKNRIMNRYLVVISALILVLLVMLYFLYITKIREIQQRKLNEAEIRRMNHTLENRVLEELKKRQEQQSLLIQKSKLESLGRLSAGIAHEINQPVTHLSLGIDNILIRKNLNKLDDEYLENKCNELFEDIERIRNIIDHIRTFSRDQEPSDLVQLNVNETVNDSINLIGTQYKSHNVILKKQLSENIGFTVGNKYKLEQVILNLFSNAKDSLEEKYKNTASSDSDKSITVRTFSDDSYVFIEITDTGNGISKELQQKVFDPFFTTKSINEGTGLGLSISYGIIREMSGQINVESIENEYTKMTISLPKI